MDESNNISQQANETGEVSLPLWGALHDADLRRIAADPMARTAMLVFEIEHLREFAGLPSGVTWRLVVHSASMLLARGWEVWRGPAPKLNGLSHEKQKALVAEYQAKGRTVSVAWSGFEQTVSANGLWIADATLNQRTADVILEGFGHDKETDVLYEFKLVGGQLQCERSDRHQTSIEDLLRLGEAYWKAFSENAG